MLKVNLLPSSLRPKMVINLDLIFFGFFILIVGSCTLSFLLLQARSKQAEGQISLLQSQSENQKKTIDELRAIESKRDTSSTQSLIAGRKKWNPFLKELTYLLPNDLWISKMLVKSEKNIVDMQLNGLAPSQKSVNRLFGRMERAPSFQNVRMNSSVAREEFIPLLYGFDFSIVDIFGTGSKKGSTKGEKDAPAAAAPADRSLASEPGK